MLANADDREPIPSKFLCRRCNHCEMHLRPDGLIDCKVSEGPVQPVLKAEHARFENCPQRVESASLPQPKLILLSVYARRLKARSYDPADSMVRVSTAEQIIRQDLKIAAHINTRS